MIGGGELRNVTPVADRFSYILLDPVAELGGERGIREAFDHLRETGYAGVELNLDEPWGAEVADVHRWATDVGVVVPSLLTGPAYLRGLCLSSPDVAVRERTVEQLIRYLDVAARLGSVLVVGLLQGQRGDESDADAAQDRIADGLSRLAEAASRAQVVVAIEPVNHLQVGFNHTVAEVQHLIARIGSAAVRPMVDTLHLHIEERSPVAAIEACGAALAHVHLCDSHGKRVGTGNFDFAPVLAELQRGGYAGFLSVKVYREPWRSVAAASLQFLRELLAAS